MDDEELEREEDSQSLDPGFRRDDQVGGGDDEVGNGDDDEEERGEEPQTNALPPKLDAWRRRTFSGAVITGVVLGYQEVFRPKEDEPPIVMEAPGEPPSDFDVELDADHPEDTVIVLPSWITKKPK